MNKNIGRQQFMSPFIRTFVMSLIGLSVGLVIGRCMGTRIWPEDDVYKKIDIWTTPTHVPIVSTDTRHQISADNHVIKKNTRPYLFTYWEQINGARQPPYITLCLQIMKKNGQSLYDVVILDERTVFNFLPDLRKDINDLPIALKTDYIRIKLLHGYGGMWLDADTIMMTDLRMVYDYLKQNIDYIGFGCSERVCKYLEGYGKPSNGAFACTAGSRLIGGCLKKMNSVLDTYYATPVENRKRFAYYDLGKKIIWAAYKELMEIDPTYRYVHIPATLDGTRDKWGTWISKRLMSDKEIEYTEPDNLQIVMLVNSTTCGPDPTYNWFCGLSIDQIMSGNYFVSKLFDRAIKFNN